MKTFLIGFLLLLVRAIAQPHSPNNNDPLAQHLFPPELVLQYQEEIGLTDKQRTAVMSEIEQLQTIGSEAPGKSVAHRDRLVELLKKEQVDEEAVLTALESLQTDDAKRARKQVNCLLHIKNLLTPDQQKKLNEFKKKGPAQFPPPALKQKLDHLQERIQDWVGAGHDPLPISELMQDFEPLLKSGKLKEADALVDRAIKLTQP
jgi:Spy/CpxP family protein refolding chaperone